MLNKLKHLLYEENFLGETYECIRDDRGFRYISEQVSHHPPVSACHAIAKNWTWWQDFRVKTKFWGKVKINFKALSQTQNMELHYRCPSLYARDRKQKKTCLCVMNLDIKRPRMTEK